MPFVLRKPSWRHGRQWPFIFAGSNGADLTRTHNIVVVFWCQCPNHPPSPHPQPPQPPSPPPLYTYFSVVSNCPWRRKWFANSVPLVAILFCGSLRSLSLHVYGPGVVSRKLALPWGLAVVLDQLHSRGTGGVSWNGSLHDLERQTFRGGCLLRS
jgi:hypothetical protein